MVGGERKRQKNWRERKLERIKEEYSERELKREEEEIV